MHLAMPQGIASKKHACSPMNLPFQEHHDGTHQAMGISSVHSSPIKEIEVGIIGNKRTKMLQAQMGSGKTHLKIILKC
jgi:hypothetical protein